jgi:N-acetylneuraminate synthase
MVPSLIEIPGRTIGYGQPCFVIAEAGVNHNGDVKLGKRLVEEAVIAGADAVKFQTWITEKLVTRDANLADYQRQNLSHEISQFEMLQKLELSQSEFREIKVHAEAHGLLFFSTPDEEGSADVLEELGVKLFKVGSGEITNLPYLRHVAQKGRPIILSTGMSSIGEVEAAVRTIEDTGNRQLCLLHCVSDYPAAPSDCNLRAMDTLAKAFRYPVGFSDHTLGIEVALAAVALGACVLEKHFTLDRKMEGPDHKASLEPSELSLMVHGIRAVERSLGDGIKRPTKAEQRTKAIVQKSIVAARDLEPGERISESDLSMRRADKGLPASCLPLIIGRIVNCSIKTDACIGWSMLA